MNQSLLTNRTFDELTIGESASLIRIVGRDDIDLFATVSGDVNPAQLAQARAEADVETFTHDVTDYAAWEQVLEAYCGPDGGLDVLVNNAGLLTFGWLDEQDPASFAAVVMRVFPCSAWP